MRFSIIHALPLLFFLIFPPPLFSRGINTYSARTTVPVTNNDIDLVRSRALKILKKRLLFMAIEDIIDPELHYEYSERLYEKEKLRPVDYLSSLRILDKSADANWFTMELEGKIYMDLLSEALRGMDFVLKKDPWVSVALLADDAIKIPLRDFKRRLALFHIKISRFQRIRLKEVRGNLEMREFVKLLFERFPANRIILLTEAVPGKEPDSVEKLRLSIFKKAGPQKLGDFALSFEPLKRSENFHDSLRGLFPDFLKLFSGRSLKRSGYYSGSELTFEFDVKGVNSPFLRRVFEDKILKANPHVRYIQVAKLSSELTGYKIRSDYDIFAFVKDLNKRNSYFDFKVQNDDYDGLTVKAVYKLPRKATKLREVMPDKRLLELIQKFSPEEDKLPDEYFEKGNKFFLTEREPNDSNRIFNRLPASTMIVGKLHSRGDNDIYQLTGAAETSEIAIDLIQMDKTSFSPQLRLYDENFSPLTNYDLKSGVNKVTHVFQEGKSPVIYLRIFDKVGFIQGETGGYKYFYYLLKYY